MIEERVILRGLMGSHSVGTNTEDSDYDFMEVVIGHEDVYLGMDWWGDQGTKESKAYDGQQSQPVLIETTSYELRKFLRLCQNFNPNVIPLLWLRYEDYTVRTDAGRELLANRHIFNSKLAVHSFCGYAYNQLKKMGSNDASTGRMGEKRKALRDKYGYDTKYAYHAIRLSRMIFEFILSHGEKLNVYRKDIDADELYAIRNGSMLYIEVVEYVEKMLERIKTVSSNLPDAPDKVAIRDLCKRLVRAHLKI